MIFPGRFDGKTLVITGAAQGLGEAVATRAAREGGAVALVDRSDLVYEVAEKLASEGAQTVAFTADLEQYMGAATAMAAARNHFGRIDILINNVGGAINFKPYVEFTEDQIVAEIRRSLFPTMWCCRAVLPTMVERRKGTIVNVSSAAARGIQRIPYSAAKGGVNALTASLAWECAEYGIRVVATAPGGIEAPPRKISRGTPAAQTEQEKAWFQAHIDQTLSASLMHRYGTMDEEVAPILFLASDEASYITGTRLPVAGGDPRVTLEQDGGGGMTVDYVMAPSATLGAAQRAIAAALKEAENLAVDVCIAVTDGAGHLLAMARMDRAPLLCVQIAQDKAYSVAAFGGLPTGDWWRLLESEPALLHGIVKTDRLIVFGGGVPLVADGRTVGAVGVSGGSSEQDIRVAEAGAAAVG